MTSTVSSTEESDSADALIAPEERPSRSKPGPRPVGTDWTCVAVVVACSALWFWRILSSHVADADAYLVHVYAVSGFDGVPLSHVYDEIARYYRSLQPGWFPLGPLPLVFWLADWPLWFVKVPQFLLVTMSFATFALVARRLFDSRSEAITAAVLALCAWQFRAPHDPVIGTSLLTPWLAVVTLLSFAGWLNYRDTGSRLWLGIAGFALLIAMFTDPLAWGFGCLLIGLIALSPLRRRVAWTAGVFVAVAIAVVCARGGSPFYWKHGTAYIAGVGAQLVAALPASYRAFGHLPVGQVASLWHGIRFTDDRFVYVPSITMSGWFAVAACTLAVLLAMQSPRSTAATHNREAVVFGLGFWLIPALLPGQPGVWQSGLPLGQAYSGVYFEYFGVAALATVVIFRIRMWRGSFGRLVPSLVILGVFIVCYGNQRADALSLERSARSDDARSLVQRAAAAGFFRSLEPGVTIAIPPGTPFADGLHRDVSDAKYALYHYARMRFNVVSAVGAPHELRDTVWLLQTSRATGMFVTLIRLSGQSGRDGRTDRAFAYSVQPGSSTAADAERRGLSETSTPLDDGRIISVRRLCGYVPTGEVFATQRPTLALGDGFSLAGPSGYVSLQGSGRRLGSSESDTAPAYSKFFMASRGSLYVTPTTCPLGIVSLTADVVSGAAATLTVRIGNQTNRYGVSPTASSQTFRFQARTHDPFRIDFATDGPVADFNPILFRYERDVPRALRLVVQLADVSERPAPAPRQKQTSRWR